MPRRTSSTAIDADRFATAWEADQDVLRNLAENGDRADIPRQIDISFRGPPEALKRLAADAEAFGFSVMDRDSTEHGEPWLFLERVQTTELEAIRSLTVTYLQIEDLFGVECDGWGCVAQTGLVH